MGEVKLSINGRNFGISCDDGQEQRVSDLGHYVDARLREISKAGAASTESHLLVLTALMLADEVYDLRNDMDSLSGQVRNSHDSARDDAAMAQTIDNLADRINIIAKRIQAA